MRSNCTHGKTAIRVGSDEGYTRISRKLGARSSAQKRNNGRTHGSATFKNPWNHLALAAKFGRTEICTVFFHLIFEQGAASVGPHCTRRRTRATRTFALRFWSEALRSMLRITKTATRLIERLKRKILCTRAQCFWSEPQNSHVVK